MGRNARHALAASPHGRPQAAFQQEEPESSSLAVDVDSKRKMERSILNGRGKHQLHFPPSSGADSYSAMDSSACDMMEDSSGYQDRKAVERSRRLRTSGIIVVSIVVATGVIQNVYSLVLILTNFFDI